MRAARVRGGNGFADSGLFRFLARNLDEAKYLVSMLNAPCLEHAFAESRGTGRHFQLKPWRKVPIPYYDDQNLNHRRLAELCESAEKIADLSMQDSLKGQEKLGQVGLSKRIREAVFASAVGKEINELAAKILPDQARSE